MKRQEWKIVMKAQEQAELMPVTKELRPLAADEIEGQTLYSLISAGTEMNIYRGAIDREGLDWGRFPANPGYCQVFRVKEVGPSVLDFKVGDLAFCTGGHGSRQRVARSRALPVPAGLAAEKVPFTRLMNIGMGVLTTTSARPPAKVIVTGLGPVGLLASMIFNVCGYDVTAVDPVEFRRETAMKCGIGKVLPSVPVDDSSYVGKVALVADCTGHEQAILDGLSIVEKGGEVVIAGVPAERRTDRFAQEVFNKVFRNHAVLRGGKDNMVSEQPVAFRKNSQFGNMAAGLAWLAEGRIKVDGLYRMVSPRDCQEVYQDVLHGQSPTIFSLFDWSCIQGSNRKDSLGSREHVLMKGEDR